jgi:hypothetical protein
MTMPNMLSKFTLLIVFAGISNLSSGRTVDYSPADSTPYRRWVNGPSTDSSYFPIAVWLQDPALAKQYKKAGFNTYVGLWKGPTEAQLNLLREAGMKVICEQNEVGRQHLNDPVIIGWMHGDEPDNAQPLKKGKGYGPPVPPSQITHLYHEMKTVDPTRPVLLNLGQGVAWDKWFGRGTRTGHPEDYPQYMKGGDIISFDIYPAAHPNPQIAGKLWYVAKGVKRLVKWGEGKKVIWNCLECTHIGNADKKATPQQVKAEAWMSIINGSQGLIYFVHQFKPEFNAAALLDDPIMLTAVTLLNRQITKLAPVLNSLTPSKEVQVQSAIPVATLLKKYRDTIYLFTAGMRDSTTTSSFILPGFKGQTKAIVVDENRSIIMNNGVFKDVFKPWGVHIYRIKR